MKQVLESLSVLLIPILDGQGRLDTLGGILWCIFIGVLLVFVLVIRQNVTLGRAISLLREKGALDKDKAVPLSELGKFPSACYKGSQTLFSKVEKDGKIFLFLPERNEKKADALLKIGSAPFYLMLLELLAFYFVLLLLYYFLPVVLGMISSF